MLEWRTGARRARRTKLRWLNLCGFCLRPGFGFPGDDFRIEQARRVYAAGLQFANQVQNEIEWWIFWGRVAGGLNKNQQTDMFQRLSPMLLPRGEKAAARESAACCARCGARRRVWNCCRSKPRRSWAMSWSRAHSRKGDFVETGLWCLARLGARKLFYGPINQVLPASTVARWLEPSAENPEGRGRGGGAGARSTGDSTRDLPAATLEVVRRAFPELDLDREPSGSIWRRWTRFSAKSCRPVSCFMNESAIEMRSSDLRRLARTATPEGVRTLARDWRRLRDLSASGGRGTAVHDRPDD